MARPLTFWKKRLPEDRFLTDSREHLVCPCAAHEDGKSSADKDCRERSRTVVENLMTPKQLRCFSSRRKKKKKRGAESIYFLLSRRNQTALQIIN